MKNEKDETQTASGITTFTVNAPKANEGKGRELEVSYDFGLDLTDAILKHTEEVVNSLYKAKAVITIQDLTRRLLQTDKTDEEILKAIEEYKLGIARVRGTSGPRKTLDQRVDDALEKGTMSDDDIKSMIAKLKGSLNG